MGYFCPDCGHPEGDPTPERKSGGSVGDWIAVADEMPDDEITVLVWCEGLDEATLAYHDHDELEKRSGQPWASGWIMAGTTRVLLGVTHWCRDIRPPNAKGDAPL